MQRARPLWEMREERPAAELLPRLFDKPRVIVSGGGQKGRFVEEMWGERSAVVHRHLGCEGCHWSCGHILTHGSPYQCVAAVETSDVVLAMERIVREEEGRLDQGGRKARC